MGKGDQGGVRVGATAAGFDRPVCVDTRETLQQSLESLETSLRVVCGEERVLLLVHCGRQQFEHDLTFVQDRLAHLRADEGERDRMIKAIFPLLVKARTGRLKTVVGRIHPGA